MQSFFFKGTTNDRLTEQKFRIFGADKVYKGNIETYEVAKLTVGF